MPSSARPILEAAERRAAVRGIRSCALTVSAVALLATSVAAQDQEPASVFIAPDGSPPSFRLALPDEPSGRTPVRPPYRATARPTPVPAQPLAAAPTEPLDTAAADPLPAQGSAGEAGDPSVPPLGGDPGGDPGGSRAVTAPAETRAAVPGALALPATPGTGGPGTGGIGAPLPIEVLPDPRAAVPPGAPAGPLTAEAVPLETAGLGSGQRSGGLGTGNSREGDQAVRAMMRQLMREDAVVALIDKETVRWSEVWESAEAFPETEKADPEAVFPALLHRLIDLKLLSRVGARQGLANDPEVRRRMAAYEQRVIREVVIERYLGEAISEAELHEAYLGAVEKQAKEMKVKARHILVESRAAAEEVIRALDSGGDFAELARKRSYGSSSARGGDLGTFQLDRMVPFFARAVTAVPAGAYTRQPVETEFGWHVILVESRSMEPLLPFEDMRNKLRADVSRAAVRELLTRLRGEAQIEILPAPERVAIITAPGTTAPEPAALRDAAPIAGSGDPAAASASPVIAPTVPAETPALGPKGKPGLPVLADPGFGEDQPRPTF